MITCSSLIPKSTPVTSVLIESIACVPGVVSVYVNVPLLLGTVTSTIVFWTHTCKKLYEPSAPEVVVVITESPASNIPSALLSAYNVNVTLSNPASPFSKDAFSLSSSYTVPKIS